MTLPAGGNVAAGVGRSRKSSSDGGSSRSKVRMPKHLVAGFSGDHQKLLIVRGVLIVVKGGNVAFSCLELQHRLDAATANGRMVGVLADVCNTMPAAFTFLERSTSYIANGCAFSN